MLGLQAKEIADVEARIAELERQLAAARGEIDALEARLAEVEAAADAAEAERNAANDAFVDPDIALLREHYDKYQHWLKHIRDRVFEEVEVQAVKSNVHTIPHTESSFKPAAGVMTWPRAALLPSSPLAVADANMHCRSTLPAAQACPQPKPSAGPRW